MYRFTFRSSGQIQFSSEVSSSDCFDTNSVMFLIEFTAILKNDLNALEQVYSRAVTKMEPLKRVIGRRSVNFKSSR